VLLAHPGQLPTLEIQFGAPFALRLDSTTSLTSNPLTLTSTFDRLPDIPLTNLTVGLSGGPASLLRAGRHLCTTTQTATANFVAASGAIAQLSVTTAVPNCPAVASAAIVKVPRSLWLALSKHSGRGNKSRKQPKAPSRGARRGRDGHHRVAVRRGHPGLT
jgi:hypothetical protein